MTDPAIPPAAEPGPDTAWGDFDPAGFLARLNAAPQLAADWEAEWADNWDCSDSAAYQARIEAGPEPEAGP